MSLASLSTFLDAPPPAADIGRSALRLSPLAGGGAEQGIPLFRNGLRDALGRRGDSSTTRQTREQATAGTTDRSTGRGRRTTNGRLGRNVQEARSRNSRADTAPDRSADANERRSSAHAADETHANDGTATSSIAERRNRPVDENEHGNGREIAADNDGHAGNENVHAEVEGTPFGPHPSNRNPDRPEPPVGLFDAIEGRRANHRNAGDHVTRADAEMAEDAVSRSFADAIANAGDSRGAHAATADRLAPDSPTESAAAKSNPPNELPLATSLVGAHDDRHTGFTTDRNRAADSAADESAVSNALADDAELGRLPSAVGSQKARNTPAMESDSRVREGGSDVDESSSVEETTPRSAGMFGPPHDSAGGFGQSSMAAFADSEAKPGVGNAAPSIPRAADAAPTSNAAAPAIPTNFGDGNMAKPVAAAFSAGVGAIASDERAETGRGNGPVTAIESGNGRAGDVARGDASIRLGAPPGTQPRVDAGEFANRLAAAVHASRDAGHQLRIRLNPPELGSLRVEVAARDGALFARLDVETQAAQRAVLENLGQLRELLAQHGTAIERIDVHVETRHGDGRSQEHTGGFEGDRPDGERREQPRDRPYWERPEADETTAARSPARREGGRLDRLDIRV
ncbi:MAG: flagellar hook-length control protein FliK [Planctomycetaceae bacterium]